MIRDTSAQDQLLTPPALWRRRRTLWVAGTGALALAALAVWAWPALSRGLSTQQSVSLGRLTVAEVERGPLARDVAGEGKVVAAVSPTLYAGSAGTVALAVQAGDQVRRGRALARIASPELTARLAQERSNADALHSEALRADADARQQRAMAQGQLDTAAIAYKTAQNALAREIAEAHGGRIALANREGGGLAVTLVVPAA